MTYKLIHSETKIITVIENTGITGTIYTTFIGSWDECCNEAIRLQLSNINEFFSISDSVENTNTPAYTVDEWLTYQGFTAIKLIALMDLENKVYQANKQSPKLTETRSWLDSVTRAYITQPDNSNNWSSSPYTFDEVMLEAITLIKMHK
jgi:hypothetical protein